MSDVSALRNYFMLRGSLLRHQQLPWHLSKDEQAALAQAVTTEEQLVARALALPTARDVHVDDTALLQVMEGFVSSMVSLGDMEQLLCRAGLRHESLVASIGAEMRAATVLERLTAAVVPTEQEVYQWFVAHPEQFVVPERREVFQILITVNDDYPENRREVARRRMDELALKASVAPDTFGELAQLHSECPTAVDAGRLGVVPPGQLYPDLDRELFTLNSGAISNVMESPLGFHLLRCGVIEPSRRLAWEEVRELLTHRLTEQRRKRYLQHWLTRGTN